MSTLNLDSDKPLKILIIGITGGLARLTAEILLKKYPEHHIHGVDSREIKDFNNSPNFTQQTFSYSRNNFERLFRDNNFDVVIHLARVSHVTPLKNNNSRIRMNLTGTNTILELATKFKTKKLIILSTHHVFGALTDNSLFIKEDAPLRASFKYPELRDVVEMDQMCTNWMYRFQNELSTIVLRPCNIIGPQIKNSISLYLTTDYAPVPMDYNPMFQFIHEFDMANVIVRSVFELKTGIYNVAPDDFISIRDAKSIISKKTVPTSFLLLEQLSKIIKPVWNFPSYLLDYMKYPVVIDNTALKKELGDDIFRYTVTEALELLKNH